MVKLSTVDCCVVIPCSLVLVTSVSGEYVGSIFTVLTVAATVLDCCSTDISDSNPVGEMNVYKSALLCLLMGFEIRDCEYGSDTFLRSSNSCVQDHMASQPRRPWPYIYFLCICNSVLLFFSFLRTALFPDNQPRLLCNKNRRHNFSFPSSDLTYCDSELTPETKSFLDIS
jgi:hypothetical protein